MEDWVLYCAVSGCAPDLENLCDDDVEAYGPVATTVLIYLLDLHTPSQDDICVIGPVDPSGYPLWKDGTTLIGTLSDRPIDPETDIRVVPHCITGELSGAGYVEHREQAIDYFIAWGYGLMVQTYALEIMALATRGRMTPLRLWLLAVKQGFDSQAPEGSPHSFKGADYGAIADEWDQCPNMFPGFEDLDAEIDDLEEIGDVEFAKQHLVHQGRHWLWMPPDRFPVSTTKLDYRAPARKPMPLRKCRSAIEDLPSDLLIYVVSWLPLLSILNLANTSQSLRTAILGDDYVACCWLHKSAPWWIPVPTQTPTKDVPTAALQVFLASQWSEDFQLSVGFPARLDWAYVMRCAQSGSMRSRERIWKTVLDIEHVADLAGV